MNGKSRIVLTVLVLLLVGGYVISTALQGQKKVAESIQCQQNMKLLSIALLQYADNWDDKLPPANHWVDCIDNDKYLPNADRSIIFHCPATNNSYGYAMNSSVGGASLSSFNTKNVILLFETDAGKRDASGSLAMLARPRHNMLNCTFCDGSVHWVNQFTRNSWIWSIKN